MSDAVCVPPWVLIDDDGSDVLLVNASEVPGEPILIEERTTFLGLVSKLQEAATGADTPPWSPEEDALYDRLRASRSLVELSESQPPWAQPDDAGSPFLGHQTLTIEVTEEPDRAVAAASAVFDRIFHSERLVRGYVLRALVRGRPSWEFIDGVFGRVVDELERVYVAHSYRPPVWICELPVPPRLITPEAHAFVEKAGRCRAVVRAPGDEPPAPEDLEACRQLSDQGFDCVVELATHFDGDVADVARAWIEDGDCSAVRVVPRFAEPPYESASVDVVRAQVDRARAALAAMASRLGPSIQRSQPWRSVLAAALVPWQGSVGWSKTQAQVHVAADGRFARSDAHARAGLHEGLDTLLPEAEVWGRLPERDSRLSAGLSFEGAPDCGSCGFVALCDRYGSPDVDLALRLGRADLAAEFARYECGLRKDALGALLDSLRLQARESASAGHHAGRTVVRFEKETGGVALERE